MMALVLVVVLLMINMALVTLVMVMINMMALATFYAKGISAGALELYYYKKLLLWGGRLINGWGEGEVQLLIRKPK